MNYNIDMIYLIYGHQLPVIKKTLKTVINNCLNGIEQDDFNVEKFSARLTTIQDIVFSARSLPLGSDHKVVVISEPYFLSNEKEKCSIEKDQKYSELLKYLESPSEFTDLIFFLESKEINSKSEIVKMLKTKAKIIQQEPLTEDMLKNMGMALFTKKGVNISQDGLNELVSRCGDDVSKFTIEANKLSLYKKNLTIDDVKLLVNAKLEDNAFLIVESLIRNNISSALKVYYDLRINKEEPVRLIALIATQFRFMNEVDYLLKKGLSYDKIASELKTKSFRINKTARNLVFIQKGQLLNILDYLYILDLNIKSGQNDPYMSFELFLINFNRIKNNKKWA